VDLCRVDFALIPDEPLFSGVIDASQAITDEYYDNANVIDEKTFPPHVSLHCTSAPSRVAHWRSSEKACAPWPPHSLS
jgi:hypothetical protein